MGQCTSCKNSSTQKKPLDTFWKSPPDTENLMNLKLPKLKFQGTLANFKIKKCSYPVISIRMEITGVDTFYLREKKIKDDQTVKWSFQQKFGFEMTQYELRKSFLKVEFLNDKQTVIGSLHVNLYLISTGPYHQDFSVNLQKGQGTRISFDMKIAQIIEIQVESILAQIDLLTKHPGEKFMFSIKTIVGHNFQLNNSSPSYTVRVMLDNKERQNSQTGVKSQKRLTRKSKKQPEKQIEEGKNLVWKKQDYLLMPSVTMKILASEIHHSYFQILLWKINDKCVNQSEIEMPQLYGQCYVALHKLFDKDPKMMIDEEGKEMQEHIIEANEKIWHHGKNFGNGLFKFIIRNEIYIKQMQVCVRTEEGILKYSPVIDYDRDKTSSTFCKEIQELINVGEQIQSNIISLDKLQNLPSSPCIESRNLKISVEKLLQRIVDLLKISSKQSIVFYSYSSEKELMKAQKIFIDLGHKTLSYLQEEDVLINELCWQILIALVKRGEFLLAHIGFDQEEKQKIKLKSIDKKLASKTEVAIMYKQLLQKLLDLALRSLNVKGLQYERNFAEVFCAYAYFRIPQFRVKVLESIEKQNDPEILEWRGIEFSLKDEINYDQLKEEVNTFTVLCDWKNSFHKCLEHEEKNTTLDNQIIQLLQGQDWRVRMSKRGIAFFYFVKYWVEYIQSMAVKTKDIQWKYFPGYNKIIKCFLVQLKKRSILQYPDALKQACFRLLSNEKLLNSFVLIIYNKVNMYQPLTIIKGIEFINQLFNSLIANKRKIPATFNYNHFYKGLKTILQGQFSFAVSKTLIMIYNHFHTFNLEFQQIITMYFLGKVFFHLFLHWSNSVRDTFYHLLVMKIYRECNYLRPQNQYNESVQMHKQKIQEIRRRYNKLVMILQNAEKVREEEKRNNFYKNYEKELHKKLKRKIHEKIKKQKNQHYSMDSPNKDRKSYPESPESEKITHSQVFDEKYSIKKLAIKKQTERTHSQVLKPTIQLAPHKSNTHHLDKSDEIKRANKKKNFDFKHEVYDTTEGKRKLITCNDTKINQYDEEDFFIAKILPYQVEYLKDGLKKFRLLNAEFQENIQDKNWEIPKIKLQMPLDGKQIKPQKIDDW